MDTDLYHMKKELVTAPFSAMFCVVTRSFVVYNKEDMNRYFINKNRKQVKQWLN